MLGFIFGLFMKIATCGLVLGVEGHFQILGRFQSCSLHLQEHRLERLESQKGTKRHPHF